MAYTHNARVHKKHKKARRAGIVAFSAVMVLLIVIGVVSVDWVINQRSSSNTIVSTENTTSVQSANVSVYRTEYFQFQAPEEWKQVVSESTENKFVYVKNDDFLITQKIVVYISRPQAIRDNDLKITNVIPVTVDENRLVPIVQSNYVSEHCNESWPDDLRRNPSRITHDNVSFVCAPSSDQYNIIIGEDDGSEDIPITLSDGTEIELAIVYSDLTAYPGTGDLFSILRSFEVL